MTCTTDTDSDCLTDGEELFIYSIDPLNDDTDSDGLIDSDEVNTYSTDPNNEDSDNDGLKEVKQDEKINSHYF